MNGFDTFYIFALFLFFGVGLVKGLLRSLIGPICLVFWSIIGVLNFDLGNNIVSAVGIALAGSFISSVFLQFLFFLGKRSIQKQHRYYVFWLSRLLGGIVNAGWNGLLIAFLAVFLSLMPENFMGLASVQTNIAESRSYKKFYDYLISPLPLIKHVKVTISLFQDRALLQQYRSTKEYQTVFSDPKVKFLLQDPDIMEKMHSEDAVFLLGHPRVQELLKDEALMTNISALARIIYRDQLDN